MKRFVQNIIIVLFVFSSVHHIAAQHVEEGADPMQTSIANFITQLHNHEDGRLDRLAGAELFRLDYETHTALELSEDAPDWIWNNGDWRVLDRRLCTGVYQVEHDSDAIYPVKHPVFDKPVADCGAPAITSDLSTPQLMQRFRYFGALFSAILGEMPDPRYPTRWDTIADINADYEREKSELAKDPHLALFWLMHFGFSLDPRYHDVKAVVEDHQLGQQVAFIHDALAFFDHHPVDQDIAIVDQFDVANPSDLKGRFLQRRAYLVYVTQSVHAMSGPDGLDRWWKAVTLYPQADASLIQRIRWLGNNIATFDQWSGFHQLLGQDALAPNISLLSYVHAQDPSLSDRERQQFANRFLTELIAGKDIWQDQWSRRFGQAMIWKIRDQIDDLALLQDAADIYFAEDRMMEFYKDIDAMLRGAD